MISNGGQSVTVDRRIFVARDIDARNKIQQHNFYDNISLGWSRSKDLLQEMNQTKSITVTTLLSNDNNIDDEKCQDFIRNMVKHAWNGYKQYAWGENEVRPISKIPYNQGIFGGTGGSGFAATIVDSLDTLLIMNLVDEYTEARDFVKQHLNVSLVSGTISVFETNIRFIGGLLSAYALTHESFYIDKAKSIADLLLKAFDTRTGIPKSSVDPSSGEASNYGWANGGSSILSEIGSFHLEFAYLSVLTANNIYLEKVEKLRDHLERIEKIDGLYPNYISPESGQWTSKHVSLGAMGDSFYEYLLKSFIQTNKSDTRAWKMYTDTIDAIETQMVRKSKGGLTYVAEWRDGILEHKMGHLSCFCVGMFALQSYYETDPQKAERIMKLAEDIANSCHESYIRSTTRIGPEMFYFFDGDVTKEATAMGSDYGYILRPEVIEGWFYLWRLSGKSIYKQWVWNAIQSIDEYCKKEAGYAGLYNVYNADEGSDDVQQSFFLAETLKYAYLTFSNHSLISLDNWVFNTEAHPFPILTM